MTSKAAKRKSGRKRNNPVSLPAWDHGAMGAANRIGLVVEDRGEVDARTGKVQNPNGVTGVRRVDLLEFWLKRGSISQEGHAAAVKLRDAFEATMRSKPALPDNDRVQSSPKPDHAVTIQIDRISRFQAIMRHVQDSDRAIVRACVMEGRHPSSIYGALRVREGFEHLRNALDSLADSLLRR
ncbi:hypothetical protein [Paracoccus sulfuroxidans]|uniref:Uncharacterized protein n=1 Tax=Paracoccus sulfuroxidans TaxID=384678 RepID=A0A562NKV4_9RHOB|nr:hypothetical protein [Paracoccus sulfuroxidans]TWI32753.1 hypothetical protein IQ24_02628 [Paracoccus sulfuroxidans]